MTVSGELSPSGCNALCMHSEGIIRRDLTAKELMSFTRRTVHRRRPIVRGGVPATLPRRAVCGEEVLISGPHVGKAPVAWGQGKAGCRTPTAKADVGSLSQVERRACASLQTDVRMPLHASITLVAGELREVVSHTRKQLRCLPNRSVLSLNVSRHRRRQKPAC